MKVAVFGPLRVEGQGAVHRRDRVVLGVLVVEGGVVSVDALALALWGDRPPPSARKVVQGSIVRWRRVMGDAAIRTEPGGYRLDRASVHLDTDAFAAAVGTARRASTDGFAHVAAGAAGSALDAWADAPLPELVDWPAAQQEIARLEALRGEAQVILGRALLDLGRPDEAAGHADRVIHERPYDERAWDLRIRALAAVGRPADALTAVQELRAMLAEELGLDPGPEIVALEVAVLRRDPAVLDAARSRIASPWPGLLPFDVDDADHFFGWDDELTAAERTLARTGRLVVVGRSGCGKSSFVRAGLVPRLRASGRVVTVASPGIDPVSVLARAGSGDVVVDQAEEVLTQCQDEDVRAAFFAALVARPTHVVVVVRADLVDELSRFGGFADVLEGGLLVLRPMDEDRMRVAVQRTAQAAGLRTQPGLVELLLRDARNEPAALPMLSHALATTCAHADGDLLTVAAYRAGGGVAGAIEATAEAVHQALDPADRLLLRAAVSRLVSTQGSAIVRLRVDPASIDDRVRERLVAARLLSVADDGRVHLAHESLVDHWPRLAGWIAADESGRRILQHLAAEAAAWEAAGEPADLLYRGARLLSAAAWSRDHRGAVSDPERRFLTESARAARRRSGARRRRRIVTAAAAVLLVACATVAGLVAADRQRQVQVAQLAQLGSDAQHIGSVAQDVQDPALALALTAESLALHDSAATRSSALTVFGRFADLLPAGDPPSLVADDRSATVATADDGQLVARVDGRTITLTAPSSGTVVGRLTGAAATPNALAFDRSGGLVAASISEPGFPDSATTIVWNIAARQEVARFDSGDGNVDANVFAADGRSVWVFGDAGVHHWDLTGANALTTSATGELTAFRSEDGLLTVWDRSVTPWIERACTLAGRAVTRQEWDRYLPDRPYAPRCRAVGVTPA